MRRPIKTVPFSLAVGIMALPVLQHFAALSWDEAVTTLAVPMFIVYVFGRILVRPASPMKQAEMERQTKDLKPIPFDIGFALILLTALIVVGSVTLMSTLIYWLIGLPFTSAILRFDRGIGKLAIYIVAYIGAALCWRWCMPILKYHLYSLVATVFEFRLGTGRRHHSVS